MVNLEFIRRIISILLYQMWTFFLLRVTPSFLRNLFKYKVFFIVYKRFNNSVFIINMVIVFYLFTF